MSAFIRKIDFNLVVILSIPFVLLASNSEWLFPYGNPSDAWINKKYFFETGNDYPLLYSVYKAARMSLHLKGLLAHELFSPLTAHYVLHLSIFCAYLAAFYLTISNLFNRHVAFISTVAFGTYSQYHAIISFEWDYEIHDSGINTLLTLLFLLLAAKGTRWRVWLVLAGATWASEVQSTYPALFIPVIIFWYLYLNHKHQRHPVLASALYVLIGGVATTFLYGIASYLLGGSLFIYEPQIPTLLQFGFGGYNFHPGYWFPVGRLLQHSKGIIIPFFGVGISAIVLAVILLKRHKDTLIESIILCHIVWLAPFACSLALHLIGHGQLTNDHMIAFMTPYLFIGFAGVYAYFLRNFDITAPSNAKKAIVLNGIVLAVFCGALIFGMTAVPMTDHYSYSVRALLVSLGVEWWDLRQYLVTTLLGIPLATAPDQIWISGTVLILLVSFLLVAAILGALSARSRFLRASIFTLCLSGFLSLANAQTTSIGISSYDQSDRCGTRKDQYEATIEAYQKLKLFDPNHDVRLWYRKNDASQSLCGKLQLAPLYGALLGLKGMSAVPAPMLFDGYLATSTFVVLSPERPSSFPRVFRAAILANDPKDHQTALNTMRSHGLKPKVLNRSHIEHGGVSFDMTIIEIRKNARMKAESRL